MLYAPQAAHVAGLDATLPASGFDVLQTDPTQHPAPYQLVHVDAAGSAAAGVALDITDESELQLFGHDPSGALFIRSLRYYPDKTGDDRTTIRAHVPQRELVRYAIDLRSSTHGAGTFTRAFAHYEPMPEEIAKAVSPKE